MVGPAGLVCPQAVLVFGSANSYRVSLAPASRVRGMSKILHLVSGFTLALPPLTGQAVWGLHVAAGEAPGKLVGCDSAGDRWRRLLRWLQGHIALPRKTFP